MIGGIEWKRRNMGVYLRNRNRIKAKRRERYSILKSRRLNNVPFIYEKEEC